MPTHYRLQMASVVYERDSRLTHKLTAAKKAPPPKTPGSYISAARSSARRHSAEHGLLNADPHSPGDLMQPRESELGQLARDIWGENSCELRQIQQEFAKMDESPEESKIDDFCWDQHIDHASVNELNDSSSVCPSFTPFRDVGSWRAAQPFSLGFLLVLLG
jgi:hypothetical protein